MLKIAISASMCLLLSGQIHAEEKIKKAKEKPTKEQMIQKKMTMLDKDGDGKISINEYLEKVTLEFNRKDVDGNGLLDATEFASKPKRVKEKKPKKDKT